MEGGSGTGPADGGGPPDHVLHDTDEGPDPDAVAVAEAGHQRWWAAPLGEAGVQWVAALKELSLPFSGMDSKDAASLAQALGSAHSLTRLDLSNNFIGNGGAAALAKKATTLVGDLNLSHNYVGHRGGLAVAKLAYHSKALKSLDLGGNLLESGTGTAFAEVLKRNPALTSLSLSENSLGDAAAGRLGASLAWNTALLTLRLAGCGAEEGALHAVATGLLQNGALTALDVGGNRLGGHLALPALCFALRGAPQLRSLAAGDGSMGPQEVAAVALAVQHHPKLAALCLSRSRVGAAGAAALAGLLAGSTSIRALHLDGSPLSPRELGALAGGVAANRSLERLTVVPSCVVEGDEGGAFGHHHAMAAALRDAPRRGGLELLGLPLCASAGALGLPPGAGGWDNDAIVGEFERGWRAKLLAFAMGTLWRLGGGERSPVYALDGHLVCMVGEAFWGRGAEEPWDDLGWAL